MIWSIEINAIMKYFEAFFYSLFLFAYFNDPKSNAIKNMFVAFKTFTLFFLFQGYQ